MAASLRPSQFLSNVLRSKLSRLCSRVELRKVRLIQQHKPSFIYNRPAIKKYFLISLIPFATVLAESSDKPFEPDDVRLRSSECLKNAAGLAVDSTSAVLSQTVYAIIKVEKEYVELLNVLVTLLEYQMQILGQKAEEERIADIVIETRHEINKVKQRKQDLTLLFASVEKLADATAEVAFATGSSYASTSAGERLYSAQQEVRRNWEDSQKAEKEVAYVEAQLIDQLTRYETKMKSRRLKDKNNNFNNNNDVNSDDNDNDSNDNDNNNNDDDDDIDVGVTTMPDFYSDDSGETETGKIKDIFEMGLEYDDGESGQL